MEGEMGGRLKWVVDGFRDEEVICLVLDLIFFMTWIVTQLL